MLPRNAYSSDEEFLAALRDMFAGQALGALIGIESDADTAGIAHDAYAYADAMLAERERSQSDAS